MLRYLFLLAAGLFLSAELFAQYPARRQYLSADGLPSSEVYYALQDRRGYMWFATDAGVSCFDGYSFTNYSTDNGLAENVIFQLLEDGQGRIWCRGMMGTLCYFSNGLLHVLPVSDQVRQVFNGDLSNGMGIDADGTVWISASHHLLRIPPPYTSFTAVKAYNQYRVHRYGSTAGQVAPEKSFTVITETGKTLSLSWLDSLSRRPGWIPIFHNHYRDTAGRRDLLAISNSLFVIRDGEVRLVYTAPVSIIDIEIDPLGQLWLCLLDKGCIVLDPSDFSLIEEIVFPLTERFSAIFRDNSNGMWLATLGSGVYYIPDMFHRQFSLPQPHSAQVNRLAQVGNRVCASGYNTAFLMEDTAGRKPIEVVRVPGSQLISAIFPVHDRLLVFSGESYSFDPATKNFTPLPFSAVLRYCATTAGGTTYVSSLARIWKSGKEIDTLHPVVLQNHRIQCLYGGQGDTLWIGCLDGLFSYQGDSLIDWQEKLGGIHPRIESITQLANGTLVLATQTSGLLLFDRRSVSWFTREDGLPSSLCRSLLTIPGTDRVWVATNNGICLVDCAARPQVIRSLSSAGGLPLGEIKQMHFTSGHLWMASDVGVIVTDTSYYEPHYTFPLYFESVTVGERAVPVGDLDLPHDSNTIDIHFTGLWFRNAGAVEYRYRLVGLDSHWIKTHERSAHFQSLPPGNYIFEVQALSPDGRSFSGVKTIRIAVGLPFWKQWWFILACFAATGNISGIWIRRRIRRARLDAQFKQQLAETEIKALRSQMNPHFIFNAINSIQHLIRTGDRETGGKYLSDFSSLLRNVLEQSRNEMITVKHELETLKLYLKIEQLRFGDNFKWTVATSADIDENRILIPPMLLQPFVENALWHGLLAREKDGLLQVKICVEANYLVCVVEDNGIGRAAAAAKNSKAHRSHGMQIVLERLEMMKQQYGGSQGFLVEDLTGEDGMPAGTRVTLRLIKYSLT